MQTNSIEMPVRVYIEDTDAGGIVYYVNYLKFMERARTELMRALGYGKAALFAKDKMFVVHSLQCEYLAPARLDDELIIAASIKRSTKTSVVFEQLVARDGSPLCRGEVKVACVDRSSKKPSAIPDNLLAKLKCG